MGIVGQYIVYNLILFKYVHCFIIVNYKSLLKGVDRRRRCRSIRTIGTRLKSNAKAQYIQQLQVKLTTTQRLNFR